MTRPRTLPYVDKRTSQPGLIQDFYDKLRQASRAPPRAQASLELLLAPLELLLELLLATQHSPID
eukprot:scaffold365550_cov47-Attheya_sp.AAC.1